MSFDYLRGKVKVLEERVAYHFEKNEWKLKNGKEDIRLLDLCRARSKPFYLYDLDDAVLRAAAFQKSGAQIHYAMKANSHPRLLKTFAQIGLGADVVSLGEMQLALKSGFKPEKIIFSGVGKDREDLEAALAQKILQINVESFEELQQLESICQSQNRSVDIAIRLNIHLTAPTHKNIQTSTPDSKFGLDMRQLPDVLAWLKNGRKVQLKSLTVHIGSQIMDASVFERMSAEMGKLFAQVKADGFPLARLDLGGGLGIDYQTNGAEDLGRLDEYLKAVMGSHKSGAQVFLEPGRFLVARMGVLLAKTIYVKKAVEHKFLILNAGMNNLMRPALYDSYHRILPVEVRNPSKKEKYTIVGPICESTDTFAEGREIPEVESGDWVAFFDAGAYGAVMANTYNQSPLPEEITFLNGIQEIS